MGFTVGFLEGENVLLVGLFVKSVGFVEGNMVKTLGAFEGRNVGSVVWVVGENQQNDSKKTKNFETKNISILGTCIKLCCWVKCTERNSCD